MTITYTAEVATCRKFGCFIKLLARWRGSIYKLMWRDVILFLSIYYGISMIYFYLLEDNSKRTFESVVYYCASYSSLIPLSFVLGFYVNLVMSRWWEQYNTIPWPDSIAVFVSAHVHGEDEGGRVMRRTVMRYVCLCLTIVFTKISPGVKKRFPKLKNLVDAGLLLENEKDIIEAMDTSFPKYPKHWMPIVWAASIITRARREGRIRDDFAVKTIIDELNSFRGRSGVLMYYDFISIPLVYTQVVTIAVYSFFVCTLLAHQWTDTKKDTYEALDFYSPIFITLQFFFYMGWLKVAETLINPFGEDDDDFEVNWMIDRNLQVSYLIVDEMHHEHPQLVKDQYWDEIYPNELPYENEVQRDNPPEASTAKYDVEDTPKGSPSKTFSLSRSERFNETFQRFINNSNETIIAENQTKPAHGDGSMQSVTDVENIKNITLYASSSVNDVESQIESEITWQKSQLETVIEEDEELLVTLDEEEYLNEEDADEAEEEEQVESHSSDKPDSDSDPFELLRIERRIQREQRMKNYLECFFGPNFEIVMKSSENRKIKTKNKEVSVNTEAIKIDKNVEKQFVTETRPQISTTEVKWFTDYVSYSLENVKESLSKHVSTYQMPESADQKEPEFSKENPNLLTELSSFSAKMQEENLLSETLTLDNIVDMDKTLVQETATFLQTNSSQLHSPMTDKLIASMENLTLNESSIASLGEYKLFSQSKATSPLGSARSISSQSSSIAEELELPSARNLSVATEYRVDLKETKQEPDSTIE